MTRYYFAAGFLLIAVIVVAASVYALRTQADENVLTVPEDCDNFSQGSTEIIDPANPQGPGIITSPWAEACEEQR